MSVDLLGVFLVVTPFAFMLWWEWFSRRDDVRRRARDDDYLDRLDRILALRARGNGFAEALSTSFHSALRRRDYGIEDRDELPGTDSARSGAS